MPFPSENAHFTIQLFWFVEKKFCPGKLSPDNIGHTRTRDKLEHSGAHAFILKELFDLRTIKRLKSP